ncbi:MAG: GNAT family N-acetyltransferase [Myxococcaceae bacterium]|nr:GNAT family N-acetyltransferase [Myxococcaceae bacterium]
MIRLMGQADLVAASNLAGQLVRQHHGFDAKRFFTVDDPETGYRSWFARQLGAPDTVLLVAEVEGEVAGYLYGSLEDRDWARLLDAHGAIHDIFVDARFRRRGLATALMRAGIDAFKQKGAKQVVLSSATPNGDAQAVFERLGFRRTMVEMTLET